MKEANLSTAMVPLVAVLALMFPLATTLLPTAGTDQLPAAAAKQAENMNKSASAETTKASPVSAKANIAEALVCEFSNPQKEKCLPCWQGKSCAFERNSIHNVTTMIATVPDPKESNYDYLFDRFLEATQRAIEAAGYTFDRYDLPWLAQKEEKKEDAKARYKEAPGVILFRKNLLPQELSAGQKGSDLLVLFLVGETPTTGVHKIALLNALTQMEAVHKNFPSDKPIRLLGPIFSGSATSLAITLHDWLGEHSDTRFNIISGSATAINKENFLRQIGFEGKADFHSTMTYGATDFDIFINKYLKELAPNGTKAPLKIAMLREATAYGKLISTEVKENEAKNKSSEIVASNQSRPSDLATAQGKDKAAQILELTFPLHISKLRTVAEKAKPARRNGVPDLTGSQPLNTSLPLATREESRDVVPMFSELETSSLEIVLSDLLATINRERVDYLGLVSSDVQDRIFLAREVRAHCPNVGLFSLNSDILYLHPEANPEFRGMLVVSPYPLFNPNQHWTYPYNGNGRRLQFPLPNAQGTYNAALALLQVEQDAYLLEYGRPFDFKFADGRKPALWVSIVGRDRLWPIQTLEYEAPKDALYPAAVDAQWQPPTYKGVKEKFADLALDVAASPNQPGKKYYDPNLVIASLPTMMNGAFSSKTSIIVLLALSLLCCVPSLVMFTQLLASKANNNLNPLARWLAQPAAEPKPNSIIARLRRTRFASRLKQELTPTQIPVVRWFFAERVQRAVQRTPLARIFGDPVLQDANLKFKRRSYQLACCLVLQGISLAVTLVYLMPIVATMKLVKNTDGAPSEYTWELIWIVLKGAFTQYLFAPLLALAVFLVTVPATLWMALSLLDWLRENVFKWLGARPRLQKILAQTEIESRPAWQGILVMIGLAFFKWRAVSASVVGAFFAFSYLTELWALLTNPFTLFKNSSAEANIFLFLRATDLTNGLSPLLPLMFVSLAAFCAFFSALRRLHLLERVCSDPHENWEHVSPFLDFENGWASSFKGLRALELQLKNLLRRSFLKLNGSLLLTLALSGMCFYLFFRRLHPTIEGIVFDRTFGLIFSITTLVLAFAFWRFVWIWLALRKMLQRLSWHPLFADESRELFKQLPKINLTAHMPAYASMVFSVEQSRVLSHEQLPEMHKLVECADASLLVAHEAESQNDWQDSLLYRVRTQKTLAEMSALIAEKLEPHWHALEGNVHYDEHWLQQAKIFLASRVVSFLHHIFQHLQNLVGLITIGLLLMLLAISSYPFQPRELLMLVSWAIVLVVVGTTLFIFVQMSRDKVLSLLTGTAPGELTWSRDFVFRVLIHGVVPIVALLGAQFPQAIGQLLSWVTAFQGAGH